MKFDENTKIQEHFKVPENYFEQFNARMMDLIPQEEPAPMKVVSTRRKLWPRYAAAAAVVGVLMVSAFAIFYSGDSMKNAQNDGRVIAKVSDTKNSVTTVAPETANVKISDQPLLAQATVSKAEKPAVAKAVTKSEVSSDSKTVEKSDGYTVSTPRSTYSSRRSNAVYASYDQNEVDRASVYMCIDNQDVSEMLYEASF